MAGAQGDQSHHMLVSLPIEKPVDLLAELEKKYPSYKITWKKEGEVHEDLWKEVTILFTLTALKERPDVAPKLEFLQLFSAGVNHIQEHPQYTSTKVPICTTSGIHGPPIAEWVLMTTLVGGHSYNAMHEWQQAQSWGPPKGSAPPATKRDLVGQRIGVLGYGSIGRQVARVAKAMGMVPIAYTASPRATPESKRDTGYIVPGTGDPDGSVPEKWYSGTSQEDLHAFLGADLDVLVVSIPLTSHTHHLLGPAEFKLLARRNAFVVNISRGKIFDQDALIAALHEFADASKAPPAAAGQAQAKPGLRGAALDVTDPEPLPPGHPLFTTPNCIVTPHVSGANVNYAKRAFELFGMNLEKFRNGEKLINEVNREKGY